MKLPEEKHLFIIIVINRNALFIVYWSQFSFIYLRLFCGPDSSCVCFQFNCIPIQFKYWFISIDALKNGWSKKMIDYFIGQAMVKKSPLWIRHAWLFIYRLRERQTANLNAMCFIFRKNTRHLILVCKVSFLANSSLAFPSCPFRCDWIFLVCRVCVCVRHGRLNEKRVI